MEYLQAINISLRALGKSQVNDENSTHPDVDIIKGALREVQDAVLSRGYWFNEERTKITPDITGRYLVPANTLTMVCAWQQYNHIQRRGAYAFNINDPQERFTAELPFTRKVNLAWLDIHVLAQTYIAYEAAAIVLGDDDGDANKYQRLQNRSNVASMRLEAEEISQRNMNAHASPVASRILGGQTKRRSYIRDPSVIGGG
jgi:hypothetical protein